MITDTNQAYFAKMSSCGVQEEANEIPLYQFFKMNRWGRLTSLHPGITLQVNNYWCKCAQKKAGPFLTLPCEDVFELYGTLNSDHPYGNVKRACVVFT